MQLPWQAPARDAAALQVLIWVWVLVTAARRGAGVFFLSPSVTMSAMLGPCPVNLQPAVVTHPEHKGGQQCGVGRRQLVEGGGCM